MTNFGITNHGYFLYRNLCVQNKSQGVTYITKDEIWHEWTIYGDFDFLRFSLYTEEE